LNGAPIFHSFLGTSGFQSADEEILSAFRIADVSRHPVFCIEQIRFVSPVSALAVGEIPKRTGRRNYLVAALDAGGQCDGAAMHSLSERYLVSR
jgi:hypothetical protein